MRPKMNKYLTHNYQLISNFHVNLSNNTNTFLVRVTKHLTISKTRVSYPILNLYLINRYTIIIYNNKSKSKIVVIKIIVIRTLQNDYLK